MVYVTTTHSIMFKGLCQFKESTFGVMKLISDDELGYFKLSID